MRLVDGGLHTQYIYYFVISREEVSMPVGSGKNA
jgi:hypothetical protein